MSPDIVTIVENNSEEGTGVPTDPGVQEYGDGIRNGSRREVHRVDPYLHGHDRRSR